MRNFCCLLAAAACFFPSGALAAGDVPVPATCTPEVNARLGALIAAGQQAPVDNVMVCGITIGSSRPLRPGRHGGHQLLPLSVQFPGGPSRLVEVVTNDERDGRVTAPPRAQVFAYGQAFFGNLRQFAAGVHDVHCSTHAGADNGWVVVNGVRSPAACGAPPGMRGSRR
jgi:hypothetical protein